MGLRKFGVGDITESETERQDLSKTASQQQGWSEEDEEGLEQESKE